MSNLNENDIAEILGEDHMLDMGNAEITYKVEIKGLLDNLKEWDNLIMELSNKEVLLYRKKEQYQVMSDKIIAETDFKELYGKNNAEVRKTHVKNELMTDYELIKDLEFSIDWIGRRISFLRELIRVKRTIMESK